MILTANLKFSSIHLLKFEAILWIGKKQTANIITFNHIDSIGRY